MKLLVATRNPGKLAEARQLLESSGIAVLSPDEAGVTWSAAEDLLEQAETFEGNARAKAEYFAKRVGLATVADDSGLEVIALGGAPGVRSRRWAGASGSADEVDAANNRELLRRLAGAPEARRHARYRCVLALTEPGQLVPRVFEGVCAGTILTEPRGTGGFGYDPLFLSDDLGRTFGEASQQEKNEVSHRGRAFRQLAEALGKSA
jgi:XTP/dITP diphosphohydrolase